MKNPFEEIIGDQSKKNFFFFEPNQEKGNPFLIVPKKVEQKEKEESQKEPAKRESQKEPAKRESQREQAREEESQKEQVREESQKEQVREESQKEQAREEEDQKEQAREEEDQKEQAREDKNDEPKEEKEQRKEEEEEDEDLPPKKSKVKKDKRERKRPDKKINKQILKYPHRIESLGDQLEIAIISMDEMMERKKLYDFLNEKIEKADEVEINSQNTNMLKKYREKKSKIKKLFNK